MQEADYYARFGPVLNGSFVANHDEWYSDAAHLNHAGALALTDWLAPQIARLTEDAR